MIPNNIIEDIKFRCPVEDVIASYVTLKRAGTNMKGLCPFHNEKTPSFTVFPQTQSFYCFGCGAGGDVISFVMKSENLDYVEALTSLAKRCGITLPDDEREQARGTGRTRILEMNLEAAKFFRAMLFDENVGGAARAYVQSRMLTGSAVKHFGLGYAPDSFDALRNHLRSKGFTYEEMQDAFLCKKSERSGNYFDLFRNRLMIPIIDNSGNVVAFGGRVLDDSVPKYLNTSDTAAFKKSKNLFALNFARSQCAERLIVCEGYMDVIALHNAGFEYSVATLGTAITSEHARMLKKYTKKVILSYDSDSAGQAATEKALRLLSEVGLEAGVLVMNGAKDPDEYIKKFGKEKFSELLDGSRTRFDYKMETVLKEHDITNDSERIKAIGEIREYLTRIPSKVEREIYEGKAAKALGIKEENLSADVEADIRRKAKNYARSRREELIREKRGFSDRVNTDFVKHPKLAKLEETVIGMILLMKEYASLPVDSSPLSEDDFFTEYCREIFKFIKEQSENGGFEFSMLAQVFDENQVSKATGLMINRTSLTDNTPDVFCDTVRQMREERKKSASDSSVDSIQSLLNSKNKDI